MEDDPLFGQIIAKNLTTGKGGIGGSRTDLELVAAVEETMQPEHASLWLIQTKTKAST